jgi:nucleoside-diphosphate-sugar epimerase
MEETNVAGTQNIVDLAIKNDCKLVYLSSAGITGTTDAKIINEDTACGPHNAYEISKYKAEHIVLDAIKKNLRTQILRPTTIFGADMDPEKNGFLQLAKSMRNGMYKNIGNGIYNIIHIDEAVRALELLDSTDIPNGGVYIINDPISYSDMDIIVKKLPPAVRKKTHRIPYFIAYSATFFLSLLSIISNKKSPLTFSRLKALTNTSTYSQEKLKRLGFIPDKSTAEHVAETCEAYLGKGILF